MRFILHTAADWLLWRIQQGIPKAIALAASEFARLRRRLLKVAARVIETASRNRVAFASACPDAETFRTVAAALKPARLNRRGCAAERPNTVLHPASHRTSAVKRRSGGPPLAHPPAAANHRSSPATTSSRRAVSIARTPQRDFFAYESTIPIAWVVKSPLCLLQRCGSKHL